MADTQANIALIRELYGHYLRGDLDAVAAGVTPDLEWHSGGSSEPFPAFGPRKGPQQMREFFHIVSTALDFDEFAPRDFYADHDKVFVLGRIAVTMKQGGAKAASDFVHIFTVANGKVTKFREFLDTAAIAKAYRPSLSSTARA